MSLVSTLAKVAVGVALAKGVSAVSKGSARSGGGGGIGDMLGGMLGGTGASTASAGGGLGDMLGGLTGGGAAGGLGGLLGGAGGGLTGQLGKMLGGESGAVGGAGGLGGILDSLGGAGGLAGMAGAGGLGALLNSALKSGGEPEAAPSREQEDQAALLLRAMIQAAKCDGRIDEQEQAALSQHLGDIDAAEEAMIRAEFARPVDVDALVADTPRGMEAQVYAMSLVGLDIDSRAEADYMHALGTALGIDPDTANAIHEKMGEPKLYS